MAKWKIGGGEIYSEFIQRLHSRGFFHSYLNSQT